MKSLKVLLATAILTLGLNANASLVLDPYFGMAMGGDYKSGSTMDMTGNDMGLRFGYGMLGLSFGIDYRMTTMTIDATSGDVDLEGSLTSAYVGYEFPIMIRVYGEYIMSGSLKVNDNDVDGVSGTIIGFGYTGLPFVAINYEMVSYSNEFDGQATDDDVSYSLLSLSFPLEF